MTLGALMGEAWPVMFGNLVAAMRQGVVAVSGGRVMADRWCYPRAAVIPDAPAADALVGATADHSSLAAARHERSHVLRGRDGMATWKWVNGW
ncbi:MAG: hypothetical protein R3B72_21135 [Polyangiaceae bacterium]